jgi:thiamine-phosphate pyrophosphorylase
MLRADLLSRRDSQHDVGRSPMSGLPSEGRQYDGTQASLQGVADMVTANAKRVEQSLRVMEELARLPEMSSMLNSVSLEQARFSLYALERDLISRISRRDKADRIAGLYVILDRQFLAGRDELDVASQAIQGGARVIQLRDKQGMKGELLRLARELKELCSQSGVLFIVNDHLDLAIAADADGLHIGQEDLPIDVVRRQLPVDSVVGCSVNTLAQAAIAQRAGADYIAVGSLFATTTKHRARVVGVSTLKEIRQTVSVPLVAIGGINLGNIGAVKAAGADAIAVVSAALGEQDVKRAVQQLIAEMNVPGSECRDS